MFANLILSFQLIRCKYLVTGQGKICSSCNKNLTYVIYQIGALALNLSYDSNKNKSDGSARNHKCFKGVKGKEDSRSKDVEEKSGKKYL